MEKYVSAETAQRLKALGFKERVLTYYENGVPKLHNDITGWDFNTSFMTCVSRPTYSQAFRWFRKEHQIEVTPCAVVQGSTKWYNLSIIKMIDKKYDILYEYEKFNTYEEAELACLDKLIEICSSK